MSRVRVRITGVVQGVGFRPFVYRLATGYGLAGFCRNDSEGVVIEAEGGEPGIIDAFIEELTTAAPAHSRIDTFEVERLTGRAGYPGFAIEESVSEQGRFSHISPDIATCPECLSELLNPTDRRHLYPFINCTDCGPRYSIIEDVPYDRPNTTMKKFLMCPECEAEYVDPGNRRFHAQPNACPECGPRVWLAGKDSPLTPKGDPGEAVEEAVGLLKEGRILAIKGLGGFHLAVDAANDHAVRRLREGKRRSNKPFAVMAPDVKTVKGFCLVDSMEERLLTGSIRPIVLLQKSGGGDLSEGVSPANPCYGVMLPYTPLHHLLFLSGELTTLVMTSGNRADEPIAVSNDAALERLSAVADDFLLHDREIYMRVDDSITAVRSGEPRVLRRARGYAPTPVELGSDTPEILACGAGLKNTASITKGTTVIPGAHIGDLDNLETLAFYQETLENVKKTFHAGPRFVAVDMHPDYMSTRFGTEYARENSIPMEDVFQVQHHHAHIAGVLGERGIEGPVIGVAFDGTGCGTDGKTWGGEVMVATRSGFQRKAHLRYMRLPGGDKAVEEPWRSALSALFMAYGEELFQKAPWFSERIDPGKARMVVKMLERGLNSPESSGAGRLFDAAASLVGLADRVTFEAEAAIALEYQAGLAPYETGEYPFELTGKDPLLMDTVPVIKGLAEDVSAGVETPVVAMRFHRTISALVRAAVRAVHEQTGIRDVALSGGVFQNKILARLVEEGLTELGFKVWTNTEIPVNDGGISIGQAVVAAELLKRRG